MEKITSIKKSEMDLALSMLDYYLDAAVRNAYIAHLSQDKKDVDVLLQDINHTILSTVKEHAQKIHDRFLERLKQITPPK